MKSLLKTSTSKRFCNLLLLIAPVFAANFASMIYWGEVEIPDSLKEI